MSAFSKEIRSFLVVSQSASIREAADRLNISAPALSRQLQLLERSYGTKLLVRSAGGVSLTTEGEALRVEALRWMAADAAVARKIRPGARATDLRLRLGIMEGLVQTLLPGLTDRLEAVFGVVELDLVVGSTGEISQRAETSELDVIVAFNMPRVPRLIVVHSDDYILGAIHAPGYPLRGEGPVQLGEALKHPLCLPSSALSMHTRLLAEILAERLNPRVRIISNSITALLTYLRAGKGVGFLTWADVRPDVDAGRLVFRPIESKRLTETLSVLVCRGNLLGDATAAVVREIEGALAEIGK